jgi:predicted DsbA family dithiol-disulfide isomerase
MQIDVISDTVCPWCYIGKRRLARALEMRSEIEFDIQWRPYQLDPNVPREGVDRAAYMKAKFGEGPRVSAMSDALKAEGLREGISFSFDKIERRPNTLDSHRLIRWAATAGIQDTVVERLFAAYFLEGRDIGDPAVLEFLAADAGMDSIEVADLLLGDTDLAAVERETKLAGEMGITGVPTFIFANKFVLSGAREAEVLVQVIDKALEAEDESAASEA